jgi:hypothetical protein
MADWLADESALIVPAPEAEPVVRPWRQRLDRSASVGVPAHLTVLYPFASPTAIDSTLLSELASLFAGFAPFDYRLTDVRWFWRGGAVARTHSRHPRSRPHPSGDVPLPGVSTLRTAGARPDSSSNDRRCGGRPSPQGRRGGGETTITDRLLRHRGVADGDSRGASVDRARPLPTGRGIALTCPATQAAGNARLCVATT